MQCLETYNTMDIIGHGQVQVLLFVPQSFCTVIKSKDGIVGCQTDLGVQPTQLLIISERGKILALYRRRAGVGCRDSHKGGECRYKLHDQRMDKNRNDREQCEELKERKRTTERLGQMAAYLVSLPIRSTADEPSFCVVVCKTNVEYTRHLASLTSQLELPWPSRSGVRTWHSPFLSQICAAVASRFRQHCSTTVDD